MSRNNIEDAFKIVYQFSQQLDGVHCYNRDRGNSPMNRKGRSANMVRGQKAWHRAVFFVGGYAAARRTWRGPGARVVSWNWKL